MTSTITTLRREDFPVERSTSLRFAQHEAGITTLGFRSQKTGVATSDYDHPDPNGEHYEALVAAERPGAFFRRALRDGSFPQHIAKRPAAPEPVQSEIVVESGGGSPVAVIEFPAPAPKAEKPAADLGDKVTSLAQRVAELTIADHPGYQRAVELTRGVKALQEEAETHHRPVIDAAHKAHKAALDALKRVLQPLQDAEAQLKKVMLSWVEAENRRRAEEERKAREEAARLQREAEARAREEHERQMAEFRRQEEAARLERERALEAELEAAEANGASAVEVEAILAQQEEAVPVFVPPPPPVYVPPVAVCVPVATAPKVAGVAVPTTVVGVVTDKAALLRYIADNGSEYEALVTINQGAIDRIGKATNAKKVLPGVRWDRRASISVRK